MDRLAGDFDDDVITGLDGNALGAADSIGAGVGYRTTLSAADAVAGTDCGPNALFTNNVKGTLYLHVVGGGTTYDVLKVNDESPGAVVV